MIVCELKFDSPDKDNPKYSQAELDYYAWTPLNTQSGTEAIPNHRLSLRKNLTTGKFEVYRRFFRQYKADFGEIVIMTGIDEGTEEVAFDGGF